MQWYNTLRYQSMYQRKTSSSSSGTIGKSWRCFDEKFTALQRISRRTHPLKRFAKLYPISMKPRWYPHYAALGNRSKPKIGMLDSMAS